MALFSAGSSLTYHLTPFVFSVIKTALPFILPLVVFPKVLFSALYSSSCRLHCPFQHSLSPPFPSTTTLTLMIGLLTTQLFFYSTHSTLTQARPTRFLFYFSLFFRFWAMR